VAFSLISVAGSDWRRVGEIAGRCAQNSKAGRIVAPITPGLPFSQRLPKAASNGVRSFDAENGPKV